MSYVLIFFSWWKYSLSSRTSSDASVNTSINIGWLWGADWVKTAIALVSSSSLWTEGKRILFLWPILWQKFCV